MLEVTARLGPVEANLHRDPVNPECSPKLGQPWSGPAAAVRQFQTDNQLPVTGIDPATWALLEQVEELDI